MKNSKGFAALEGLLMVVVLVLIVGACYYVFTKNNDNTANTQEHSISNTSILRMLNANTSIQIYDSSSSYIAPVDIIDKSTGYAVSIEIDGMSLQIGADDSTFKQRISDAVVLQKVFDDNDYTLLAGKRFEGKATLLVDGINQHKQAVLYQKSNKVCAITENLSSSFLYIDCADYSTDEIAKIATDMVPFYKTYDKTYADTYNEDYNEDYHERNNLTYDESDPHQTFLGIPNPAKPANNPNTKLQTVSTPFT